MTDFKCPSCGSLVSEDERYCSSCGENNPKFVDVSNTNSSSSSYSSSNSSSSYSNSSSNSSSSSGGIGWFILGLFFPLVGFILYFTFKRENPNASSMSAAGAWVGLIFGIIFAAAGY